MFLGYSEDVKKTEKLVIKKNIKLASNAVLIILNPLCFCSNKKPRQTIIIKLM